MIHFTSPKYHWNYFLAIERDLENLSRYIEFADENLRTYSIELTHILLSASSEVDVIMKQLCAQIDSTMPADNINDYMNIILTHLPGFIKEEICIDRFGLSCQPWISWNDKVKPNWWRSYTNVKHHRNSHFHEASLQNTINAVGALLITAVYYYKYVFTSEAGREINFRETTLQLQSEALFLRINADYYHHFLMDE
jgi:hypothetical protein